MLSLKYASSFVTLSYNGFSANSSAHSLAIPRKRGKFEAEARKEANVTKLTGPRLERAMLRQAKRVPNDKGSSLSTVGELNPRERMGGNSSRSIPCGEDKA